jgi:hypothetical protein
VATAVFSRDASAKGLALAHLEGAHASARTRPRSGALRRPPQRKRRTTSPARGQYSRHDARLRARHVRPRTRSTSARSFEIAKIGDGYTDRHARPSTRPASWRRPSGAPSRPRVHQGDHFSSAPESGQDPARRWAFAI